MNVTNAEIFVKKKKMEVKVITKEYLSLFLSFSGEGEITTDIAIIGIEAINSSSENIFFLLSLALLLLFNANHC